MVVVFSSLKAKFILPEQMDSITMSIILRLLYISASITRHANRIRIATYYVESSLACLTVRYFCNYLVKGAFNEKNRTTCHQRSV